MGLLANAVVGAVFFPLARAKALLELQGANKYQGVVHCLRTVLQERGLADLWRGIGAFIACSLPSLLFKEKDVSSAIVRWFKPETPGARVLVGLGAQHAARLCSAAVNFPLQTLFLRRASALPCNAAATSLRDDVAGALSSRDSFWSLYSGILASTFITQVHNVIWFPTFDALRKRNPWARDTGVLGRMSPVLMAQLAFATAGFAVYPLQSAVRRLQVDSQHPKEQRRYRGVFHCLRTVAVEEGVPRLWAGYCVGILDQVCQALPLFLWGAYTGAARAFRERTEYAECFDKLDLDHDGFLTQAELRGIVKKTTTSPQGRMRTMEEAAQVLAVMDKDGDGRVSLDEFLASMHGNRK